MLLQSAVGAVKFHLGLSITWTENAIRKAKERKRKEGGGRWVFEKDQGKSMNAIQVLAEPGERANVQALH